MITESRMVWAGMELKVNLFPAPWQGCCVEQAGFGGSCALLFMERGNTFL